MPFTPTVHHLWFALPAPTPDEDPTTGVIALISEELNWSSRLLACLNEDLLKATYSQQPTLYEDLQKEERLTELLATITVDAHWLERTLKAIDPELKKIILEILKNRLQKDLTFHIGKDSTHPSKAELIDGLKIIYAVLTNKCPRLTLSDNERLVLQSQLLSGIATCTPGFFNRVQEILQSLKKIASPPASIALILANIRSELVREAASRYRNIFAQTSEGRQWLAGNETHFYNQFTLVAHQQGYGVPPISTYDPVQLDGAHVTQMRQHLADVFAEKYTLFGIFHALPAHIKSALAFFSYTHKKSEGESYTIRQCQQFTAYLNQLCGLSLAEDSDEYLLKDAETGYWIDIDWPALNRKLWLSMEKAGYFAHDAQSHQQFFAFLQLDSNRKNAEQEYWQKITYQEISTINHQFFLQGEDVVKCIKAFGLNSTLQRMLLAGWVGIMLTSSHVNPSNRQKFIDRMCLQSIHNDNNIDFIEFLLIHGPSSHFELNIEQFWNHAIANRDLTLLKKMTKYPCRTYFTTWQRQKQISPQELFNIIRTTPPDFLAWPFQNMHFHPDNATYVDVVAGTTLLHHAAARNNVIAVKLLIALGVNINHKNRGGHTASFYASNNKVIKQLLDNRQLELNLRTKLETEELADSDDLAMIAREYPGISRADDSLLMIATKHGRIASIKRLLAAELPVDLLNFSNESALSLAFNAGHNEILELLLDAVASFPSDRISRMSDLLCECLLWSVTNNRVEIFNLLHKKYAAQLLHVDVFQGGSNEYSLLMVAVEKQSLAMVNAILATGKFVINYEDDNETALSLAAAGGNIEIVKALLAAGAIDYCVPGENRQYVTPALVAAAKANHAEIFRELLKHAPYVSLQYNLPENDDDDEDECSRPEEFPAAFDLLIAEEFARRAAVFSAIDRGDTSIDFSGLPADCVISSDYFVTGQQEPLLNRESFLLRAVDKNRLDLVKILLAKGANVEQNWGGDCHITPLVLALKRENYLIAAELLAHGARSCDSDDTLNSLSPFEFILDNYKPDGLAFLLAICEKTPACWESIFGGRLSKSINSPTTKIQRLITLGSQNPHLAKKIFQQRLAVKPYPLPPEHESLYPISIQKLLTLTAEGQAVLRHLDIAEPSLSKVVAEVKSDRTICSERKVESKQPSPSISTETELMPLSMPATPADPRHLSLPIKRTMGDGNCAFHAIFGRWNSRMRLMVDEDHRQHRQQLVDAVLATTVTAQPQRYRLMQECILALIHEASLHPAGIDPRNHPNLQALLIHYQKHALDTEQAFQDFREAVSANEAISNFIDMYCHGYRNPSGAELTSFQDKYIHIMNNCRPAFEELLTSHGLQELYAAYQTLSTRNLLGEIAAQHIAEYTTILGRNGQHLLAQEISLLAEVFNKRIVYHLGVGEKTLPVDTFHRDGAEEVAIRHNGVNHFERIDDGRVSIQPPQRPESKKTKLLFFAPQASSQKTSRKKRSREDSDLSAHGKKGKIDKTI